MADGGPSRWRSGRKAFGAIWPPGIMSTRGLAPATGARAAPPTTTPKSSLPTLPRFKPERAVSCFLRRGTRPPGNSTETGRRLSVGFRRALAGTLPGPVVRLRAWCQGNRREQGNARRGDMRHDTHTTFAVGGGADVPDIPEVVSEQSGAGMPRRHARTLSSESRCRMSLSTTRGSPKRCDAWLAEATAGTGTSAFRRSDMMAGGIAGAARAGRPGGASRGRASRPWRSVSGAAAVDVDLIDLTDRKGAWALVRVDRGTAEHLDGMQASHQQAQAYREGTGVKRHCSDTERRKDVPSP